MNVNFDDIRSFDDKEYAEVVKKLLNEPAFVKAVQYFFPDITQEKLEKELISYSTVAEIQGNFFFKIISKIKELSMKDLSFSGLDLLTDNTTQLYISNHRDIVLDSALINYGLNLKQLKTSEIAIGSNLLGTPWVKDLVRLNRSFIVKRNIPKQEMLEASIQLSNYIQYVLKVKKQSIWIAQREGRAKDGNDKTNPGLLKMFVLSSKENLIDFFLGLNITPVSISYEYDPCDVLKIPELIAKFKGETYVKKEGEDNLHMVTGINGQKGNVKVVFGEKLNKKIEQIKGVNNRNELLKNIAQLIDEEVYKNYHLWPTNYIAYDVLNNVEEFSGKYTTKEKDDFLEYIDERLKEYNLLSVTESKIRFLEMYANPVKNQIAVLTT